MGRLRGNWTVQLPLVFSIVVASFLAAMVATQWQVTSVGTTALEIADGTAPSIEHLADARGEMLHLEVLLREYVDAANTAGASPRLRDIDASSEAMNNSIAQYLELPVQPSEQRLWDEILRTKNAFDRSVERALVATERRDQAAEASALASVSAAGDGLSAAITRDMEFNADEAHALALNILHVHQRSLLLASILAVLCVAVTAGGATALRRVMRQRDALSTEHQRLVEARATELEEFAGRVAHDILSPLSVVGIALKTATAPDVDAAMRSQIAGRGTAAIKRIDRLVNGLLAFAVAGAEPEQDATADVAATIGDLEGELREEAARAGAELVVDVKVEREVACNAGVLTSIVANLARNAIKYIGDGPVRRIDIRAFETKDATRIEVQDTGPGLKPDLEPRVFEPYVRGHRTGKGGIGLGLATVKRVVTAHHGRVGVKSTVGRGCTFWVELPTYGAKADAAAREQEPVVH